MPNYYDTQNKRGKRPAERGRRGRGRPRKRVRRDSNNSDSMSDPDDPDFDPDDEDHVPGPEFEPETLLEEFQSSDSYLNVSLFVAYVVCVWWYVANI